MSRAQGGLPNTPGAVVVTGSRGFIGRAVVRSLRREEIPVIQLVRGAVHEGETEVDLTHVPGLLERLTSEKIEAVCHCAWTGHPRSVDVSHEAEVTSNVVATLNVALACGLARVPHVVFLSSGGGRRTGSADGAPPPPYGWAKAIAAAGVLATAESFGFSASVLRPTAVYGPGQDPSRLLGAVSVFAARLLAEEPIEVFGSLDTRRDFLHVDDLASLVVRCIQLRLHGEFDVGGPELLSLQQVIDALAATSGLVPEVVVARSTGVDPPVVRLDNKRISEATDWVPLRGLSESLPEILAAYIVQLGMTDKRAALLERLTADAS